MYNDIIKLSQNISKLETERNELLKIEKKAEEIQKKNEIIDELKKDLTKLKKEKKNADLDIVKCEDMINDIMIHINLNYINMILSIKKLYGMDDIEGYIKLVKENREDLLKVGICLD